jgi:hypothetical protein
LGREKSRYDLDMGRFWIPDKSRIIAVIAIIGVIGAGEKNVFFVPFFPATLSSRNYLMVGSLNWGVQKIEVIRAEMDAAPISKAISRMLLLREVKRL